MYRIKNNGSKINACGKHINNLNIYFLKIGKMVSSIDGWLALPCVHYVDHMHLSVAVLVLYYYTHTPLSWIMVTALSLKLMLYTIKKGIFRDLTYSELL